MIDNLSDIIRIEASWLPQIDADVLSFLFSVGTLLLSFSCGLKIGDRLFSFWNLIVFIGVDVFVVLVYIMKFGAAL